MLSFGAANKIDFLRCLVLQGTTFDGMARPKARFETLSRSLASDLPFNEVVAKSSFTVSGTATILGFRGD